MPSFVNRALPILLAISSLVFLVMGGVFVAPYWLADGVAFAITCVLSTLAIRSRQECEEALTARALALCRATYCTGSLFVLVDIGFVITAGILWNRTMNPFAWTDYGRNGSSFLFCSLYSAIVNSFVVYYFCKLSSSKTVENKPPPDVESGVPKSGA